MSGGCWTAHENFFLFSIIVFEGACTRHAPSKTIMLKRAVIIWRYKNVAMDAVYTFDGTPHVVRAGYWTFGMLKRELEQRSGIGLEARPHDGKCKLPNNGWKRDGKCKLTNNGSFTLVFYFARGICVEHVWSKHLSN